MAWAIITADFEKGVFNVLSISFYFRKWFLTAYLFCKSFIKDVWDGPKYASLPTRCKLKNDQKTVYGKKGRLKKLRIIPIWEKALSFSINLTLANEEAIKPLRNEKGIKLNFHTGLQTSNTLQVRLDIWLMTLRKGATLRVCLTGIPPPGKLLFICLHYDKEK